jgi:hypothetical protein
LLIFLIRCMGHGLIPVRPLSAGRGISFN